MLPQSPMVPCSAEPHGHLTPEQCWHSWRHYDILCALQQLQVWKSLCETERCSTVHHHWYEHNISAGQLQVTTTAKFKLRVSVTDISLGNIFKQTTQSCKILQIFLLISPNNRAMDHRTQNSSPQLSWCFDTCWRCGADCLIDEVAEWLRRWTANPLCSARVGSNPILVGWCDFDVNRAQQLQYVILFNVRIHDTFWNASWVISRVTNRGVQDV